MEAIFQALFEIPIAYAQKTDSENVATETGNQLAGLFTSLITQIPLWFTAIIVIVLSFVVARMVKAAVENKMTAEGFEEEHREIQIVAGRAANAIVLIMGITVGLKIAGLDLTPIIAAGAFGIGFALQDLIMNFLAGVMILTARHYTIGDAIKVNGTLGKIMEIQTRATILKAFDGTKIVVPNAVLFKNQVTNYSGNPFRRLSLVTGVAYGSDLKKVMKTVLETVQNIKGVLADPKPGVLLYEWGDYSINFKINVWVDAKSGRLAVRNRLIIAVDKALSDAGIEVPYPIQTIYMSQEEKKLEKISGKALQENAFSQKDTLISNSLKTVTGVSAAQPAASSVSEARGANATQIEIQEQNASADQMDIASRHASAYQEAAVLTSSVSEARHSAPDQYPTLPAPEAQLYTPIQSVTEIKQAAEFQEIPVSAVEIPDSAMAQGEKAAQITASETQGISMVEGIPMAQNAPTSRVFPSNEQIPSWLKKAAENLPSLSLGQGQNSFSPQIVKHNGSSNQSEITAPPVVESVSEPFHSAQDIAFNPAAALPSDQ